MRRAAWGWAVVALVAGCERPRTELVVRVDSELAWGPGAAVQSVVLVVRRGGASGPIRSARTTALGEGDARLGRGARVRRPQRVHRGDRAGGPARGGALRPRRDAGGDAAAGVGLRRGELR